MLTLEQMAVHFTTDGDQAVVGAFNNVAAASTRSRGTVTENFEESGVSAEQLTHKFEHMGMQSAFVFSAMAEGSERGMFRLAHSVAQLGFMFGPVIGILTTTAAILGERIADIFTKTSKAEEDAVKKATETAEEMRILTDYAGIKKNQLDQQAHIEDANDRIVKATERLTKAQEEFQKASGGGLYSGRITAAAKKEMDEAAEAKKKAEEDLKTATEAQKKFNDASLNIRSARAENAPKPSQTTAAKDATAQETEQINHELAIRRAQLANNYADELRLTITWVDQMAAEYGKNSDQYKKAEEARLAFAAKTNADLQKYRDDDLKQAEDAAKKSFEAETKRQADIAKAKEENQRVLVEGAAQLQADIEKGLGRVSKRNEEMLKKMGEDGKKAMAETAARAQEGASIVGGAITAGFTAAFSGKGVTGAFAAFSGQIMDGLASIMQRQGEAMMAQGAIMLDLLPALTNPFTSGPALLAAGAALVALGATLSSISHSSSGGGGGGGATSYTSGPTSTTGYTYINPYASAPGTQATTKGMSATAPVVVNATIIGKDDPSAQRQIMDLVRNAQLRMGST